ncbi:F-box/kelch-repeat protein At3g23880-like [Arachis stenosperma]|uniref:F-box/kelch-repeat protein At3g23880-like n=1 Tax=Arachis stenosperma TaxID=217475 RepID=UPI0025ACEDCD|nr:F-box/kelch-repeat protein At3g23880-like [Arachis stenosperma]
MKHHEYENNLPGDLIREIFVRLPVRILQQLRIVCRSWNSLISSPEFAIYHLQRSTLIQPPPLLCWKEPGRTGDIMHCSSQSLIPDRQHQPITLESHPADGLVIQGSCNGLLCLSQGYSFETLTLFNPSTRSVSPSVPFECSHECGWDVFCGFGYDTLHDQYKFVMGCSDSSLITDSKVRSGAIVFTFSANPSWKTVDHPVFPYYFLGTRNGIFVSGTLNWIVYDPTSTMDYDELEWFVLTFDLETELFGQLCMPLTTMRNLIHMPHLQLHNNCLSVCYRTPNMPIICTFWIMKEYGVEKSWIKLFEIPFGDEMISPYVSAAPLYISEDHNLLALDKSYRKFLVYNLRQNQLVVFQVPHGYHSTAIFLCHESLVSPSHYSPSTHALLGNWTQLNIRPVFDFMRYLNITKN